MGRITVFTGFNVHSQALRQALQERQLPYAEISLADAPERRVDLKALVAARTSQLSLPQVFFNTRHVGGVPTTLAELSRWDAYAAVASSMIGTNHQEDSKEEKMDASNHDSSNSNRSLSLLLERYRLEVGNMPEPNNPRMDVKRSSDAPSSQGPPGSSSSNRLLRPKTVVRIPLPDGTQTTVLDMMEKLRNTLPRKEHAYNGTLYRNSFTGQEAVQAFVQHRVTLSYDEALTLGQNLQKAGILDHVAPGDDWRRLANFTDSEEQVFRLQCDKTPDVLNSYRIWNEPSETAPPSAAELVARLDDMLTELEISNLNAHGQVDHARLLRSSAAWCTLEEALCATQRIDWLTLSESERKVLGVNLYRLMLRYALIKFGVCQSEVDRGHFHESVKFNVGGHVFSLQEWIDGVLRGNRTSDHPSAASSSSSSTSSSTKKRTTIPFGRLDARRKYMLKSSSWDHRMHFALHAGTSFASTGSLPFCQFTVENWEEELEIATRIFCGDDDHVHIMYPGQPLDHSSSNHSNSTSNSNSNNSNSNGLSMMRSSTRTSQNTSTSIHLSKLFHWYRSDFAKTEVALLEIITNYLDGYKKLEMKKILAQGDGGKSVTVHYMDVDWGRNVANATVYRPQDLRSAVKQPRDGGLLARMVRRRFQPPKNPDNERLRLETLRNLNILDTLQEERFDRITRMVQETFNVPMVFISLVDENRQWFKSTQWACTLTPSTTAPREADRETSFCGHAINNGHDDILLIPNALEDDRFAENPVVTGPMGVRFYAGYALSVPSVDGTSPPVNIGTLCIVDQKPRDLTDEQLDQLRTYGAMVQREILRRDAAAAANAQQ